MGKSIGTHEILPILAHVISRKKRGFSTQPAIPEETNVSGYSGTAGLPERTWPGGKTIYYLQRPPPFYLEYPCA